MRTKSKRPTQFGKSAVTASGANTEKARTRKLFFSDDLAGKVQGMKSRTTAGAGAGARHRLSDSPKNHLRFSNTRYTDRFLGKHSEDEQFDE